MELTVMQFLIFVCTILLSGNIYFVKRLVDRIDQTYRQLQRIEIDVAVIKSQLKENGLTA